MASLGIRVDVGCGPGVVVLNIEVVLGDNNGAGRKVSEGIGDASFITVGERIVGIN